MPVHFKTQSEYKSHYKTFQSRKSAAFEPTPEQAALAAGQASTKLGIVADPPMQSKKRTQGPSTTLGVGYYDYNDNRSVDPDYALLGANDKFVPNIRYKYKSSSNGRDASPPKQQKLSQKTKQGKSKENIRPPPAKEIKPAPVVNTEIYRQPSTPLAPRRPKYESVLSKEVAQTKNFSLENMNKQESITKAELKDKDILRQEEIDAKIRQEREKKQVASESLDKPRKESQKKVTSESVDKPRQEKAEIKSKTFKKSVPSKTISEIKDNMNEFVQTNMDKGIADSAPEAPTEYAMKYKAGIAPPRPRKKFSEYQKQFTWKDGGKSSPLLDAEQVIYKSNANISPTKKDIVPKVSEYRNQFKEWKYKTIPEERELFEEKPRKRSKVRRSKSMGALSPDKLRPAGSSPVVSPDNKRLTKEYEQQQEESMMEKEPVPKITHGKMKRAKSEYDANFKPPSSYNLRGVHPPQTTQSANFEEKVPALSNWFAEVIELRRKAAEYKKRAQGTHFSREHIVQLMAKQAEMWDAVSSRSASSTISALSLESGASARARKEQRARLEEEDENDNKSDRATMATEDDHHGSDKDFREVNGNLRKESNVSGFGKTRTVGTTAQEKYQQKYKPERKSRKKAWAEEPTSPGSQNLDDFEDDDGRIPTPILRSEQKKSRHHFDLTTPCVGGALLTSPPAVRKERKAAPTSKSWSGRFQDLDEDSDDTLVEQPSAPLTVPGAFDVKKGNIAPTPTYGMPSRDSHFLRDDSESVDQPLTTSYVHSPIKIKIPQSADNEENPSQKPRRSSKLNVKSRAPVIPSTVQEGFGQTYNKPAEGLVWSIDGGMPVPRRDVDDDVLSTSARSIASSCSVASETLERARKRKEEFWGKNGIATR